MPGFFWHIYLRSQQIEFEGLLPTQSLEMDNLFLSSVRLINLWWTLQGLSWHKSCFPSFSIGLPPDIQQTAGHVMIPTELGRVLLAFLQQLHHLQLELPQIAALMSQRVPLVSCFPLLMLAYCIQEYHLSTFVVWFQ
jgi:hypothetical protein